VSVTASRLELARRRRGMTLTSLAEELGVTSRTVRAYEKAEYSVPAKVESHLADVLDCAPGFLTGSAIDPIESSAIFFRARRRMSAGERDMASSAGRIGILLYDWFDQRFVLPTIDVPTLDDHSPEQAAELVRSGWGLGSASAPNMVHLLESHGIRVMLSPSDVDRVDAFSVWHRGAPYVFLSAEKTPERARFDAAHELGHLVMHSRETDATNRDLEREADQFASAFLMPRNSILATRLHNSTSMEILAAKKKWRVSAMALTRRLYETGQISSWQYQQLCIQLSKMGYRSSEPIGEVRREQSSVFLKIFGALRSRGITSSDIGRDTNVSESDLHRYTFGFSLQSISGGRSQAVKAGDARPTLTLISS
jgi:Zn-dependent peptidase ImmA (M78 family)/transcriptional regulator with XRE-family HTH domain